MIDYKKKAVILQCGACKDVIQSQYRRHFAACHCGQTYTDGGDDYIRIGAEPGAEYAVLKEFGVQGEQEDIL